MSLTSATIEPPIQTHMRKLMEPRQIAHFVIFQRCASPLFIHEQQAFMDSIECFEFIFIGAFARQRQFRHVVTEAITRGHLKKLRKI